MSMASVSGSFSKPFQCYSYQQHLCITSDQPAILVVVCLLIQLSKYSWLSDSHVHLVVNPIQFQSKSRFISWQISPLKEMSKLTRTTGKLYKCPVHLTQKCPWRTWNTLFPVYLTHDHSSIHLIIQHLYWIIFCLHQTKSSSFLLICT